MNDFDIAAFRESLKDFSLEELKNAAAELQSEVSRMILDSELIIKAAVVDALIQEKETESTK